MKTVTINDAQLQIIMYFGIFIFTSLVGIIVWLAKKVDERQEKGAQGQIVLNNSIIAISKDLELIKNELLSAKESLKDIPEIRMQIRELTKSIEQNTKDYTEIKIKVSTHEKAISEMKLVMAKYFKTSFEKESE